MAGPGRQRKTKEPRSTLPSTSIVPLHNANDPNDGAATIVSETSENVSIELDSSSNELETQTPASGITSKKRGRGPNRGIELSRQVEKKGKLDIMIPERINKPVGENHTKLPREIGFLVRSIATMRVANWSEVEVDQKKKIIKTLLNKFNLDLTKAHVKSYVEDAMKRAWQDCCSKAHLHYKALGGGENGRKNPHKIFLNRPVDWQWLCDYFDSEAFKKVSMKNSKNRACLTVLPKTGSVSLVAYQYEEGCGDIDLYKAEYTDKNGNWVDNEHENIYNKMKSELQQATDNGTPINEAAICAKYLGTPSGYIRGKGRGPKPPKKVRSSSTIMDEQMPDELTKAKVELTETTKKLEVTSEELAATKKKLNKQEKVINWMKDIVTDKFGMTLPSLDSDDESGDD